MDTNTPARYLDTAYTALKSNPGATNQILQAAAQGAPVGLKGIAAAAAQQSQQQIQQAMAAMQQRGPQPNIIQRIATQGIMQQYPHDAPGIDVAREVVQNAQPMQQGMAGGGLVAFADGGGVLPPDVIDAIQSHFAEGGSVRGFAEGYEVDAAPHLLPSEWARGIENIFAPSPGRPRSLIEQERLAAEDAERRETSSRIARYLQNMVSPASDRSVFENISDAINLESGDGGRPKVSKEAASEKPPTQELTPPKTDATGATIVGKAPPSKEAQKGVKDVRPVAEQHAVHTEETERRPAPADVLLAREETPSITRTQPTQPTMPPEQQGLGNLEQMRDAVAELRGRSTMNPDIAKRLEELEGQAGMSTLFQTLLGGLAGGLSEPRGGQFALARGAQGALSGYQQGMQNEDSIRRSAFNILKGYADAPAEEQAKAADAVLAQLSKAAERQSAERVAQGRSESSMEKTLLQGMMARDRAELMANRPMTEAQGANYALKVGELVQKKIADWNLRHPSPPTEADLQKMRIDAVNELKEIEALSGQPQRPTGFGGNLSGTRTHIIGYD